MAAELRDAWQDLAQAAEARVAELEQACACLRAESEGRARQLAERDRALAEQRQRLEALQRSLNDLRQRVAAAEVSPGRRLLARLGSRLPGKRVLRACIFWV